MHKVNMVQTKIQMVIQWPVVKNVSNKMGVGWFPFIYIANLFKWYIWMPYLIYQFQKVTYICFTLIGSEWTTKAVTIKGSMVWCLICMSHLNPLLHKVTDRYLHNRFVIDFDLDAIVLLFCCTGGFKAHPGLYSCPENYVENIQIISTQDVTKWAHFDIVFINLKFVCVIVIIQWNQSQYIIF